MNTTLLQGAEATQVEYGLISKMTYKFKSERSGGNGFKIIGIIFAIIIGGLVIYSAFAYYGDGSIVPKVDSGPIDTQEISVIIFDKVNEARQDRGLAPLKWNYVLANMAYLHSQDMATEGFYDHVNLQGEGPMERALAAHSCFRAENIMVSGPAYGKEFEDTIADQVFSAWMASSGHRQNILDPTFQFVGVGAAITSDGREVFVTQDFC